MLALPEVRSAQGLRCPTRSTALERTVPERMSKPHDGDGAIHAGHLAGEGVHLLHGGHRAHERGGLGQGDGAEEVPLVLLRDEPSRARTS